MVCERQPFYMEVGRNDTMVPFLPAVLCTVKVLEVQSLCGYIANTADLITTNDCIKQSKFMSRDLLSASGRG